MDKDKKHKNRFSIVFNEFDDRQLFAIEKLNSLPPRKIAVYIADVISKYEKRGKTASKTTTTTEKRGRGRPKKVLNPEGVSGDEPILPAETSSSHIQEPINVPVVQSQQSQHGTTQDTERQAETISVDGEMLDSMLAMMGR